MLAIQYRNINTLLFKIYGTEIDILPSEVVKLERRENSDIHAITGIRTGCLSYGKKRFCHYTAVVGYHKAIT